MKEIYTSGPREVKKHRYILEFSDNCGSDWHEFDTYRTKFFAGGAAYRLSSYLGYLSRVMDSKEEQ